MYSTEGFTESTKADKETEEGQRDSIDEDLISSNRMNMEDAFMPLEREIPTIDSTCYDIYR